MSEERRMKAKKGNNLLIILFVFIQFQVSSVCNLHGFSPQGDYGDKKSNNNPPPPPQPPPPPPPCNNSKLSEIRIRRDGESFYYNSFVSFRKFNEKINYLTGTGEILTREIKIKQGRLKGVVKEFKNSKLKNVETYLGIPYAAPPIKSLRFMPPGSPPTWKGVKILDTFGAVCPQKPPDLSHEPMKTMNAGHFNHLKGLMAFLSNQSEDCLYLNIYAPMQDHKYQQKYPVIVYIHGESFEWNSGNPYDGSILASYGNVVVVTINFRLGILGFLRPGLSDHTVSNFGLLDQIAALQWIKENIEEFGGDSSLVTLMGHGTGAACINFLMVSPVSMASQGLFHKAILMSGTALSDWALTHNPLQFTIQVAEALNCPLIEANDELSNCLRRKRLSEIMSVKITVPEFQTAFGPIVDGSVVPNTPQQVMGVYQNLFTRYELLYGMTEWETYHLLDPVSLTYGMLEGERNEFLRKYMYSRYEALPYFALATTLSEYLDWRKPIPPAKSAAEEHRDLVLDLLSDAMFGAPIIQMALYHSKINPKSYLYIFQHKNKFGEFAGSERSISGEEIAYVFGIPLLNEEGPLSHHKFSISEQLLSESILTYFTNFAKTGNPNAPRRSEYLTQGPKEWQQYDVYWPEYDSQNQSYLAFDIPPHVSHHYRSQMTQFWNEILPDLLNNPTKLKPKPEIPFDGNFINFSHHKMSPPSPPPNYLNPGGMRRPSEDSSPWTYGTVRVSPEEYQRNKRPYGGRGDEKENHSSKQMDRPLEDSETRSEGGGATSSSSVPYFVALSVCLLIINASVIGFYCHKRKRLSESRRDSSTNPTTATTTRAETRENDSKKTKCSESVYSVVECSESSHTKTDDESKRGGRLKRCLTNTTESSSKVRKWFQQEVMEKYSKNRKEPSKPETIVLSKTLKSDSISECSTKTAPPLYIKPILKNPQRIYKSNEDLKSIPRKQVQKVSVGVDATPSTRGDSVLKQTPIEITKSLDRGLLARSYSAKTQADEEEMKSVRRSRTSVSLQLLPTTDDLRLVTSGETETIKLEPRERGSRNNFRTFAPAGPEDVNVTSRDSEVVSISDDVHVDPLENIQRRNFPKVLPDFPGPKTTERLSFPQSSLPESNRTKIHPPPPPPPRVSTLQRREDSGEQKFSTFSSVTFKKPETENEKIGSQEQDTDDSSSTTEGTIKKQPSGVKKVEEQKENRTAKRREQPSIVIQPKIGPKKSDLSRKGQTKKFPHVNLQLPNKNLDTKGPSDRV